MPFFTFSCKSLDRPPCFVVLYNRGLKNHESAALPAGGAQSRALLVLRESLMNRPQVVQMQHGAVA